MTTHMRFASAPLCGLSNASDRFTRTQSEVDCPRCRDEMREDLRKITVEEINDLLSRSATTFTRVGPKTGVLLLTLPNGFELEASAACLNDADFSEEIGRKVALERVKNQLWLLMGWLRYCDAKGRP